MAEFNVKTISCSSKIKAKIELNIGSLEQEYKRNKLDFEKIFAIDSEKGSNYTGRIVIRDTCKPLTVRFTNGTSEPHQKYLQFFIAGAKTLDYQMNLDFPETITKQFYGSLEEEKLTYFIHEGQTLYCCAMTIILDDLIGKFKSLKAVMTVEFEPGSQLICKEKFKNYVNSFQVFKPDGKGEDVQIVCQGEVYGFNKSILCNISPVFERMLTNPNHKEYKNGLVEITDTTPQTVKAFKNILTRLDYIETENFSIELLMLAHKYEIAPLEKLCQEYLCTTISKENLFDIIQAADLTKDEELMSKAAEFIGINRGTFNIEDNPEWNDFCKKNPECTMKILNLMMFKKQ